MQPFIFSGLIFLVYILISIKVHRQLCWYIDWVNIVFTFIYEAFSNCHHHLGFLKVERCAVGWVSR
jgi:hypothetical protein